MKFQVLLFRVVNTMLKARNNKSTIKYKHDILVLRFQHAWTNRACLFREASLFCLTIFERLLKRD